MHDERTGNAPARLGALLFAAAAIFAVGHSDDAHAAIPDLPLPSIIEKLVADGARSADPAAFSPRIRALTDLEDASPRSDDPAGPKIGLDAAEARCLAIGIYHEARGEPDAGQIAVGQVIMNRVRSNYYPDTPCGVVFQNAEKKHRCQFSFACDGRSDEPQDFDAWARAVAIAGTLVEGDNPALDADLAISTHYHATSVRPGWAAKLRRTGQIGRHIFYFSKAR